MILKRLYAKYIGWREKREPQVAFKNGRVIGRVSVARRLHQTAAMASGHPPSVLVTPDFLHGLAKELEPDYEPPNARKS